MPTLYVMVGISASGKSTWASHQKKFDGWLSACAMNLYLWMKDSTKSFA